MFLNAYFREVTALRDERAATSATSAANWRMPVLRWCSFAARWCMNATQLLELLHARLTFALRRRQRIYDMRRGRIVTSTKSSHVDIGRRGSSSGELLFERTCVWPATARVPRNKVRRLLTSDASVLDMSPQQLELRFEQDDAVAGFGSSEPRKMTAIGRTHALLAQLKLDRKYRSVMDITDTFNEYWPSFDEARGVTDPPTLAQFLMVLAMRNVLPWKTVAMMVFLDDAHMDNTSFLRVMTSNLEEFEFQLSKQLKVR